jgi:hypothetical protein
LYNKTQHHQRNQKSKKKKWLFFFVAFAVSFFASCKAEPAFLEAIIISLYFVAKCVNFFLSELLKIQKIILEKSTKNSSV